MKECKNPGFCNCMSSLIAKLRLRVVIKADREAVPCGRWVIRRRITWGEAFHPWRTQHPLATTPTELPLLRKLFDKRPRYRWEVRR